MCDVLLLSVNFISVIMYNKKKKMIDRNTVWNITFFVFNESSKTKAKIF